VAERTLYLPSVGLVLAGGAWLGGAAGDARAPGARTFALALGALCAAGALRTATRVPVWRDDAAVVASMLQDSPRSYRGYAVRGGLLLRARRHDAALADLRRAASIYGREPGPFIAAADAAFSTGRVALADTLLDRATATCPRCGGLLRFQAAFARSRGDTVAADSLLAHSLRLAAP
jgi:hypothetical protein